MYTKIEQTLYRMSVCGETQCMWSLLFHADILILKQSVLSAPLRIYWTELKTWSVAIMLFMLFILPLSLSQVCEVADRVLKSPIAGLVKELNPVSFTFASLILYLSINLNAGSQGAQETNQVRIEHIDNCVFVRTSGIVVLVINVCSSIFAFKDIMITSLLSFILL